MSPGGLRIHPNRAPSSSMDALPFAYVSQGRVRRLATVLLVFVLISAATMLGDLVDLGVLVAADRIHVPFGPDGPSRTFLADADAEMLEMRGLVARSLYLLAFVGCAVVLSRFLVQANRNAAFLGVGVPTVAPGSMVLWFFVPIACLVRPYLAVRELWEMSAPRSGRDPDPGTTLATWWIAWLAGLAAIAMAFHLAEDAATPAEWIEVTAIDLAAKLAWIVAAVLMLRWTRALSERQDDARAAHVCDLAELR